MIKSGKYRPNVDNNSNNSNNKQKKKSNKNGLDQGSSHDEDEASDSYLHPLLRGGANNDNTNSTKKSDETVRTPSIPMNIHNTAYGQLIKKYEHLRQREKVIKENDEEKMSPKSEEIKNEESSPRSDSPAMTTVIPPPPDVKPIIDKLAEYVARNGSAFEQSIRIKNDPRFGFLERDHIHHNYYQLKVQLCAQEVLRNKTEENQRSSDNDEQQHIHGKGIKLVLKTNAEEALTPTSCREFYSDEDSNSVKQNEQDDSNEFIGPRPPSPDFLEKMRKQEQRRERVNDFVRDKIARDKQEERKRKAEMLVQQLKTKTNDVSSTTNPSESTTVNPVLIEKLLNVKTERSLTTTITSPHHTRHAKHSRSPSKSHSRSKYYRRSRSRSNHRRQRRSSHKRSRTRSKSRTHHRSKRSKNSKSSKYSRHHRHRRHRHSSTSSNSSSASGTSSSSSNSSLSSSSHDKKKKKKVTNNDDEQRQNQRKKNPQSSKWDQREPVKSKNEVSLTESSTNTETTLVNSTS